VKELKAGRIEFKMDSTAIVHSILGKRLSPKTSWPETRAFLEAIENAKPSTAKGVYIRSVTLTSTMGPGVSVVTDSVIK
jgi:large subunit ribosomal protein L1